MNWTFTFVFSDFPNHLLNAFWDHFFMDFYQSGRVLSHSAVFMLLCVLLHHFFSVFCSYVNHLNMPFASSWHNVVLLELSTLFVKLRLIFVSFSHFSLNFCIVSFPFFAYNKLNTTFRTDSSPPGDPWKEFYHMKHSKKLVTLSVLTTMSGAAIYFLNKTLDTAAVRKNLLASAEKEIFSWQFGDIFYTKKGTGTPMLLLHDLHLPPAAANGSILRILSPRITPSTHSISSAAAVPTSRRSRTRTFYTYSSSSPSSNRSSDVQPT